MSLQKMLEYQKIDSKIYRLEKEYNELEEKKEFNKYQGYYKEKAKSVIIGQKEFENIVEKLNGLLVKAKELNVNKFDLSIESNNAFENEEDFDNYEKKLKKYQTELNAINETSNELQKKLSDLSQSNKQILNKLRQSQELASKFFGVIQQKKKKMQEQAKPEILKRDAIKAEIDEDIFKIYEERRNHHIFPVFMPYNEPNCGACGIDVKAEISEKFNSQTFVECPHCRRLLYKI
ncbi:MAG: hypothetical protein WCR54_06395 [Clostridia bacterium]